MSDLLDFAHAAEDQSLAPLEVSDLVAEALLVVPPPASAFKWSSDEPHG